MRNIIKICIIQWLWMYFNKDKTEKYGRWLGIIHYKTDANNLLVNLNEQLVTEGLAQKYLLD